MPIVTTIRTPCLPDFSWILLCSVAVAFLSMVSSHKDGAPISACNTMLPSPDRHHGHGSTPNRTQPPYTIEITDVTKMPVSEYIPGGRQVLRIHIGGPTYKGYLLQGRSMLGVQRRVGEFLTPLPVEAKFLPCDGPDSRTAVTHSCSFPKQEQSFFWRVPEADVGPIYFIATIVAERTVYWTLIQSIPLFPALPIPASVQRSESSCGRGFGCVRTERHPSCRSRSTTTTTTTTTRTTSNRFSTDGSAPICNFSLIWQCAKRMAVFEMMVTRWPVFEGSGGTYAALILSQDERMGDDEVLICELSGENQQFRTTFKSFYHPNNASMRPFREKMTQLKTGWTDSFFYCRFSRPLEAGHSFRFDLERRLHIRLTFGKVYKGGLLHHIDTNWSIPLKNGTWRLCSHPDLQVPLPTSSSVNSIISDAHILLALLAQLLLVYVNR